MATGEGGLAPNHLEGGCDVVMQMGTAKYGVRDAEGNLSEEKLRAIAAHQQVRMFEVKLAQGAKPGKEWHSAGRQGHPSDRRNPRHSGGSGQHQPKSPQGYRQRCANSGAFVNRVRVITGKPVGVKFVAGDPTFLDEWFTDCVCPSRGMPGLHPGRRRRRRQWRGTRVIDGLCRHANHIGVAAGGAGA